jgi:NAD(P)-dependent dehydrogenase (short-subunit alcohol dehydrogenase family)
MLDVNILGTSLGLKHAFRAMRPDGPAGQGGAVVNVSSVAATITFPGISGYSPTKSAVDRLTRVAAMESGKLGYGVRVNCIYPGLVPTEMGAQWRRTWSRSGCGRTPTPSSVTSSA